MTEDYFLKAFNLHEDVLDIFTDIHLNALAYPLRVCHKECPVEPKFLVQKYIESNYKLASDWLELASHDYYNFHSLFPLWHRGKLDLKAEGKRLSVTTPPRNKAYEAYNRLLPKDAKQEVVQRTPLPDFEALLLPKTSHGKDWFRVNFDPPLVAALTSSLKAVADRQHSNTPSHYF